jgi:glycosyltransferase involved in cell wall biosynthesis
LKNKVKVACIVNMIGVSTIPIENFVAVDTKGIEKHVVVFQQGKNEAEAFINDVYPNASLYVHSCADMKGTVATSKYVLNLKRLFRKLQPDVVHVHHTRSAIAAALLRPFLGFRLLSTAHTNFGSYSFKQKIGFGFAFLMSDQIACNSINTLASLPAFITKNKRQVIYNGVNFQEVDQASSSHYKAKQGIRIGTICRMVPAKDLGTLIHGFALIAIVPGLEDAELRLVGDGPEEVHLKSITNEFGLADRVKFTGALSRKKAYQELANFDIFVVSSRWEGFCNAMVEAAAAGKALVASNIEPLPEVIGSENALFFEVGNDNGLARALETLCKNPVLRKTLGRNAQAFVRSRYPIEKSAREYEQVYKTLGHASCELLLKIRRK